MLSFEARIKSDPKMTVAPEKAIMPVKDPCSWARRAPAIGPPTRALEKYVSASFHVDFWDTGGGWRVG